MLRLRVVHGGQVVEGAALLAAIEPQLQRAAHRLVPRELRAKVSPEDVVQSAWVEVCTSIASFRGRTLREFESWALTILLRRGADVRRTLFANSRSADREQAICGDPVAATPTPQQVAVHRERLRTVSVVLRRMPRDQRRVLIWSLGAELSHREVAARLGRSVGACRVLLARARARLRTELGATVVDLPGKDGAGRSAG